MRKVSAKDIMLGRVEPLSWERPDYQDAFEVVEEDETEARFPRAAKQFVKKIRRKEARLRAKGRIA